MESEPQKQDEQLEHANEGVIRNFSVLDTAGDLTPAHDGLSPYNRYEDKEGGAFYAIFRNPKMQFVVSELASLAVPVAPVLLRKKMPEGNRMDFSAGVEQHPDFGKDKDVFKVDQTFLYCIFADVDHFENWNYTKGVHYDFNVANFKNKLLPREYFDLVKTNLEDSFEVCQKLKEKIADFKKQIDGEEGLNFIKAVVKKAEYTDYSSEDIQKVLLSRCNEALTNL